MAKPSIHRRGLIRASTALLIGLIVGLAVGPFLGIAAGLLAGWAAVCVTSICWIMILVWPMDAAQSRAHATEEDPGRRIAGIIALIGSIAALGAVYVVLTQSGSVNKAMSYVHAGIAVIAVASSWTLIQVDYMLRIARVYFTEPVGGIDFHQHEDPMYSDFAYVAFGLGMTYQIADTDLRTNELRRLVLGQTLLAYLFGAVILATVINLVTSLG
jgi:uncharacterized membrane protein